MSRATELTEQLRRTGHRPAGSDAERRAAIWAAAQISVDPRREAVLETFWGRPNWALAQSWHIALAVAGGLLSSTQASAGAAVIFVALLCVTGDWLTCVSPGRWLTHEQASQNVVSRSPREQRVRLIITAPLDSARTELDGLTPLAGWLFWIAALMVWLLITALARIEGRASTALAVLQLIPTVALVGAGAWLWLARRPGDNAAGVGAALALTRLLDAAPPANLAVDLVLTGAGTGDGLGLRRYLRRRRDELTVTNTVVIGTGAGPGAFYLRADGPLLPLRFFAPLQELAHRSAMLSPASARGCSAALPARLAHLPALSIGGDPDRVVEAGLELVDAIDAYVGALAPPPMAGGRQGSLNPRLRWVRRA
jgi:hypothetical protein